MIKQINICTFLAIIRPLGRTGTSYPYNGVHLWRGDLLGPLYGCQDLLLVLEARWWVREEGGGEGRKEESEKDNKSRTETRGRRVLGGGRWRG